MKRLIMYILAAALLLCGCQATAGTDTASTESTGSTGSIAPTGNIIHLEDQPSVFLVEPHWDSVFYPGDTAGFVYLELWFLSREPVSEADVQLSLDTQTSYEYRLVEDGPFFPLPQYDKDGNILQPGAEQFTYDLYLCYRGADWEKLAKMRDAAAEASKAIEKLLADGLWVTNPQIQEQQKIVDAYQEAYYSEWDNYRALTEEMLPKFYAYQIWIDFDETTTVEETFSHLSLRIGEGDYSMDISPVTLRPGQMIDIPDENFSYLSHCIVAAYPELKDWKYNGGTMRLTGPLFTAEEDLVLTGLRFNQAFPEILQIHVMQTSSETSVDFYWDGTSKVRISKGDSIQMMLTVADSRFLTSGFDFRVYLIMDYTAQGQAFSMIYGNCFHYVPNYYELYAEYIDGIDLKPYYTHFYYSAS